MLTVLTYSVAKVRPLIVSTVRWWFTENELDPAVLDLMLCNNWCELSCTVIQGIILRNPCQSICAPGYRAEYSPRSRLSRRWSDPTWSLCLWSLHITFLGLSTGTHVDVGPRIWGLDLIQMTNIILNLCGWEIGPNAEIVLFLSTRTRVLIGTQVSNQQYWCLICRYTITI